MEHVPPPAEELALLDRELARLDLRRAQLLTRRAWLVSILQAPRPVAAPPVAAPVAGSFGPPFAPPAAPARPADGGNGAQNLLLTLGGLLLTVAAIAFTLVSWGHMGIGGRSAVLATVTAAALAAPALLLRRGLTSTAESLGALAAVLMVLDAYALHRVALADTDPLGYAAVASAVLAVVWAAYGLLLDGLRLPLPLAVLTAQLPLVLGAAAEGAAPVVFAGALLVTAALDCAVAVRFTGLAVRVTAGIGLWVTGGAGLLVALGESLDAARPSQAVVPGALLLAGAAIALAGARRAAAGFAGAAGAVAGLAAVAAVGGVLTTTLSGGWSVPVYLVCGGLVLLGVRAPLGRPVRQGLAGAAGVVALGAVLFSATPVAVVLVGPVAQLGRLWSGVPDGGIREALGASELPWDEMASSPVVLLMVAVTLGAARFRWESVARWAEPVRGVGASGRGTAGAWALVLGWAGLTVLAPALDVSYAVAVATQSVLVVASAALVVGALRRGTAGVAVAASVCGAFGAVGVALLSLCSEPATYAVFVLLTAVGAGVATALDGPAREPRPPVWSGVRSAAACAAVAGATVLAVAGGASLELEAHETAPLLLVVTAVTAVLGAVLKGRALGLPVEAAGVPAGAAAVVMAVGDMPFLALVLALCGTVAAGTALRPERRPVAGYVATALFVLASWVRLSASGVGSPEAYTLPVSVPVLVIGWLRRRRDPAASSWTAYGAGLAVSLVPSLLVALGDTGWTRPLLLGVAALVITLLGARLRLQALLVLGGSVLALDALHELAPYVVQVVGAMPRWVVPALAGAVLLAVGATYEKRLRDARRLRDALGRMR
ncbi:SCO7613 C-terminal domain-containing membrane protein [Streptomyces sp. NPDC057682]|uniref:SCO7613 C-terminal domain-containing membrane protein n=1 Tax=Streptomyces sp. NPDC057682 TaxID=3346210 RepID=UPI0036C4F8ED